MTSFQILLSVFLCIAIDNLKNVSSEVDSSEGIEGFNRFKEPTVFIAILVRNKAQTLPFFLTCLEKLNYSKNRIHLWIRSDHNEDKSIEILQEWLSEWAPHYHGVDAELTNSPPYRLPEENGPAHWPLSRYSHIISLREKALNAARQMWADFVWLLDSDVFLTLPEALTELVQKQLPIAVPMLKSDGLYSNFWCGMNEDYYYLRTDDYEPILHQKKTGCFSVPMVHSAVLIHLKVQQSDDLTFMPHRLANYKGPHDDIITFALSANYTGVPLFICNDHIYGYVMVPLDKDDSLSYDKLQLTNLRLEIMVDSPPLAVSGLLEHWVDVPSVDHLGVDKVFMINLLRRPERRTRMKECFRILGVNASIVDAVDGQTLNDTTLEEMGVHLMDGYVDPYHKRPMKRGEIGCFLSHYYIWKEMMGDESLDKVIVLEDDVRFEPFFRQKMDSILMELEKLAIPWDLVYLGRKRLQEAEESTVPGSQYLVYPNYSYWTLGYMLSKSGAKKLMAANPLDNLLPVDEFLPILYDKHPDGNWKSFFPTRDLLALSAEPLIIYPTRYLHEEGYVSDTEDSLPISTTPRDDL